MFRLGRQPPAHAEIAELIVENLTQFTETRRVAVALVMFGYTASGLTQIIPCSVSTAGVRKKQSGRPNGFFVILE